MSAAGHLEVDSGVCVGSSWCTTVAAGVFRIGPDGKAHVADPDAAGPDEIDEAVDSCPVSAISVRTDEDETD